MNETRVDMTIDERRFTVDEGGSSFFIAICSIADGFLLEREQKRREKRSSGVNDEKCDVDDREQKRKLSRHASLIREKERKENYGVFGPRRNLFFVLTTISSVVIIRIICSSSRPAARARARSFPLLTSVGTWTDCETDC